MEKKLDMWEWMRKQQNEIGGHLRKNKFSQGIVTIENQEDKFVMMVMMPKDGKLKIHSDGELEIEGVTYTASAFGDDEVRPIIKFINPFFNLEEKKAKEG